MIFPIAGVQTVLLRVYKQYCCECANSAVAGVQTVLLRVCKQYCCECANSAVACVPSLFAQGEHRHLGPRPQAEGQAYVADADVDVEGAVSLIIHPLPFGIFERGQRTAEYNGLHGVRVPRQHQGDVGGGKHFAPPVGGVVAEKYLKHTFCTSYGTWKVGILRKRRFAIVLHADEGNAVSPVADDVVAIVQHPPTHGLLLLDKVGQVVPLSLLVGPSVVRAIVVVAQNGVHPVGRMELGEDGLEAVHLVALLVHQVAGKHNQRFTKSTNRCIGAGLPCQLPRCRSDICTMRYPSKPSGRSAERYSTSLTSNRVMPHTDP